MKQSSFADKIWGGVGILVAIFLLFYMIGEFIQRPLIPVTGGYGEISPEVVMRSPSVTPGLATPASVNRSTDTPTLTVTPSPSSTQRPTRTPTPPGPTPGPGLMTPFGPEGQFLLHEARPGESYTAIAKLYQTTVEVLEALNYRMPGMSLWVGQIIVVLPGQTENAGLPAFQVVHIEERITLEALAEEYGVSVDDLRYYNALGEEDWVPAGRLLIILVEAPDS